MMSIRLQCPKLFASCARDNINSRIPPPKNRIIKWMSENIHYPNGRVFRYRGVGPSPVGTFTSPGFAPGTADITGIGGAL